MKVNPNFIRASILGEIMRTCSMDEIANAICDALNEKKDIDVSVSETHGDGIVIRKRDCDITDKVMYKQVAKALRALVSAHTDIADRMQDNYDFTYAKSCLTEDTLEGVLIINRNGRLITLEFDI